MRSTCCVVLKVICVCPILDPIFCFMNMNTTNCCAHVLLVECDKKKISSEVGVSRIWASPVNALVSLCMLQNYLVVLIVLLALLSLVTSPSVCLNPPAVCMSGVPPSESLLLHVLRVQV